MWIRAELKRTLICILLVGGLGVAMTSPVSHGFPDWGRQRAASDISILSITNQAANPVIQSDILFVGNMPYMFVEAIAPAGRMVVDITWFADAGGIDNLGGDVVATPSTGDAVVCIPVRGPYVRFDITATPAPTNVNLRVFMTPQRFNSVAGLGHANLISENGGTIGAGATQTFTATRTRAGWATWSCAMGFSNNFTAALQAIDFNGGITLLGVAGGNVPNVGAIVLLPALPINVVMQNFDGVAQTRWCTVVHHPFMT